MTEIWKPTKIYSDRYLVSNLGNIKRIFPTERILKCCKNKYGYRVVTLFDRRQYFLHLLVWDAFDKGDRRIGTWQVDHINNDKTDNRLENLQLLTPQANTIKYHKTKNRNLPIGIHKLKSGYGYQVKIGINGKREHLGTYLTLQRARKVLNYKLLELGELY